MSPPTDPNDNVIIHFANAIKRALDGPVIWFRETIVVPNQQQYNWYHRRYRRVPTIDECYEADEACIWEADMQFLRDKSVDEAILNILRFRFEDCMMYERPDSTEKCAGVKETYEANAGYYAEKYGDIHPYRKAKAALSKQKHRMLWERRYGPVGTGMSPKKNQEE